MPGEFRDRLKVRPHKLPPLGQPESAEATIADVPAATPPENWNMPEVIDALFADGDAIDRLCRIAHSHRGRRR